LEASIVDVRGGWKKLILSLAGHTDDTGNIGVSIELKNNDGYTTYAGDGSSGLYIWGAQLEEKPFTSSYIPTNGAAVSRATQAADASGNGLSIALADLDSRVLPALGSTGSGEGTILCEIRPEFPMDVPNSTEGAIAWGSQGLVGSRTSGASGLLYLQGGINIRNYDGVNVLQLNDIYDTENTNIIAVGRWSGATKELLAKNEGAASFSSTSGSFDGDFIFSDTLYLFFNNPLPMWLRNLRFYDKALTETEIESEVAAW
jgi:hypothetical protein